MGDEEAEAFAHRLSAILSEAGLEWLVTDVEPPKSERERASYGMARLSALLDALDAAVVQRQAVTDAFLDDLKIEQAIFAPERGPEEGAAHELLSRK